MGTGLLSGFLELDFVEEAALEGSVEVLCQIGGGYHDAVELFHLLQDDVLNGVLHLVYRVLCPLLADADDGVGLVEEQDGSQFGSFYLFTIAVEQGFDVFLGVAHPFALYLRHIHHHNVAPRLSGQA